MAPVLEIVNCGNHGRGTKDILGGPKSWGPKKKVARVEIFRFLLSAVVGPKTISRTVNMALRGVYETRPKFWKNLNMGGKFKCGGFNIWNFVYILEKIQKIRGNKFLLQHFMAKKGIGRGTYIF